MSSICQADLTKSNKGCQVDLDDLIALADPARGWRCPLATVADARRVMDATSRVAEPRAAGAGPLTHKTGWSRLLGVSASIGAIAIVGAVAAVFLLTHNPGTPASTAHPQSGLSVKRQLVRDLGVLRRPQTPAERAFKHPGVQRTVGHTTIDPKLTREVRLAHGLRVWLYVVTGGAHDQGGGLGVEELQHKGGFGGCCTTPEQLERPSTPGPLAFSSSGNPHQVYFEVVPDGVARVRWTFPRNPGASHMPHPNLGPFAHSLTATVVVHHNVAAAVLPDRWAAQTVTWYDSAGRIVARHTSR